MIYYYYKCLISLLVMVSTQAAPENLSGQKKAALVSRQVKGTTDDLKTASSSYSNQYSNWGGHSPGGYGFSITGVGTIDRSDYYDPGYNTLGGGYEGCNKKHLVMEQQRLCVNGVLVATVLRDNHCDGGRHMGGMVKHGLWSTGFSQWVISTSGFGASALDGASGYINNAGYGGGNGGYGGYGGNGGLISYYGYNNPSYQGGRNLGYGLL
nr:chorion class B protein B.L1-like [Maniola hyperantus]